MTEEEYLELIEGKLETAIENIEHEMKLNDRSTAMRSTRTGSRCSITPISEAEI